MAGEAWGAFLAIGGRWSGRCGWHLPGGSRAAETVSPARRRPGSLNVTGYSSAGRSYVAMADAGGVTRDLSPWVERVGPLGRELSPRDATGVNDGAPRTAAGTEIAQELTLSGRWDDTPGIGPDAVLSGIVGRTVAVEYGPAGQRAGPASGVGTVRVPVLSDQQRGRRAGAIRGEVPTGWAGGAGDVVTHVTAFPSGTSWTPARSIRSPAGAEPPAPLPDRRHASRDGQSASLDG